jgi:streptogramin lyase
VRAPDPSGAGVSAGGVGGGASRRQKIAAGLVLLVAAGAAAAIFTVESRSSPPPKVVRDSLIRIDPRSLQVTNVARLPATQPDLVVDAGGYVWVTTHVLRDTSSAARRNAGDRALIRFDPRTGETQTVAGLAPCGLAADPSGDVWVATCSERQDGVVRVDAKTLQFGPPVYMRGGEGYYQGLAYGDSSVWVGQTNGSGTPEPALTQIDARAGRVERTIHPALLAGAMAFANFYNDVWMTNFGNGTMTRYDVATGKLSTVPSGVRLPGSVVVDGNTVWVGDWGASAVARLHAVGPPRARRLPLPATFKLDGIWNLAAGAGFIWAVSPRNRTIWRIDPKSNAVKAVHIPYLPAGVAADANDVWVTVRGP